MFRKVPALLIIASLSIISCTTNAETVKTELQKAPEPEPPLQEVQLAGQKPGQKSVSEAVPELVPEPGNPKERAIPADDEVCEDNEEVELPVLQPGLMWAEPDDSSSSLWEHAAVSDVVFNEINTDPESAVEKREEPAEPAESAEPSEQNSAGKSFLELMFSPDAVRADEPVVELSSSGPEIKVRSESTAEAAVEPAPGIKTEPATGTAAAPAVEPEAIKVVEYEAVVREIFAAAIPGEGWILEEIKAEESGMDDMLKYSGREYLSGKTFFKFFPYSTGRFLIKIRKPDYSTGLNEIMNLSVTVSGGLIPDTENTGGEPAAGLVEDSEGVEQNVQDTANIEEITMNSGRLKENVQRLMAAGGCLDAARMIEDSIEDLSWSELDWFYFTLAGMYESCPAIRDERTAAEYYRKIVDYYPISNYWIESRERIIYLERNFIYIR